VLKKSFLGDEQTFLGPLMGRASGDVRGPHRFKQKRPPTIASALRGSAAVYVKKSTFAEFLVPFDFSTFATVSAN
jgi:hypothetical protein